MQLLLRSLTLLSSIELRCLRPAFYFPKCNSRLCYDLADKTTQIQAKLDSSWTVSMEMTGYLSCEVICDQCEIVSMVEVDKGLYSVSSAISQPDSYF